MFHGKCAYCEGLVGVVAHGDLEQFRPKKLYPHLAHEWNNLLYACQICNQVYKRDQFPTEGPPVFSPFDDLSAEVPLLLDPCSDQPQEHLAFSVEEKLNEVQVTGLTDRGRASVAILGLSRPELVSQRYKSWRNVRMMLESLSTPNLRVAAFEEVFGSVRRALDDSAEYAGAVRQLCRAWLEGAKPAVKNTAWWAELFGKLEMTTVPISREQRQTAEHEEDVAREQLRSYSVEAVGGEDLDKFNFAAKRIERIEVRNLRAIPHLDLTLPAMAGRESWIMLIGENGVGKSTILQGVALALMGEERANRYGLDASQFVRRGKSEGFVSVHINAIGAVTLRFSNGSREFTVDPPEPKVPLLAYGPTRLLPSETDDDALTDRNIRTDNLFKPTVPLSDAESWLAATWEEDEEYFRSVGRALCRLLLIGERSLPRVKDGRVEIKMPDGWRRISDLSAGYRSVLALVVDIAIGTSGKRRKVQDAVGIVLLDEIEVHLHPVWKISIVERLRNVFPQLSFLATTHDPLCLKGLYDREIVVLRRGRSGVVSFAADLPSVDTLEADEILTSKELFELPSSRNRTSPVTIARYSALLNKPAPTENERRELLRLGDLIGELLSGALTPMQREVERALTGVMEGLLAGKSGQKLRRDVVAEIRRRASEIGGEP
ncbi:MAG TPA: AAA family ATPase [Pyrinomonadaceae bacterium]|nr:AAA family ATPase [Pyrinomonadaceae bacterium]